MLRKQSSGVFKLFALTSGKRGFHILFKSYVGRRGERGEISPDHDTQKMHADKKSYDSSVFFVLDHFFAAAALQISFISFRTGCSLVLKIKSVGRYVG